MGCKTCVLEEGEHALAPRQLWLQRDNVLVSIGPARVTISPPKITNSRLKCWLNCFGWERISQHPHALGLVGTLVQCIVVRVRTELFL